MPRLTTKGKMEIQGLYDKPAAWRLFQQAVDIENSTRDNGPRVTRNSVFRAFMRRYVENRLGPQPDIWPEENPQ